MGCQSETAIWLGHIFMLRQNLTAKDIATPGCDYLHSPASTRRPLTCRTAGLMSSVRAAHGQAHRKRGTGEQSTNSPLRRSDYFGLMGIRCSTQKSLLSQSDSMSTTWGCRASDLRQSGSRRSVTGLGETDVLAKSRNLHEAGGAGDQDALPYLHTRNAS